MRHVIAAHVPGDSGPPLIGHTLRIRRDPVAWGLDRLDRHGPVSWSRAWGTTVVNVVGADAIGEVLTDRDGAFANGPGWGPFLEPFFTRGLMLLDGDEHRHHRRIMTQAFTPASIADYHGHSRRLIGSAVAGWPAGTVTLLPKIKQLTLDVAARAFLGARLGPETDTVRTAFIDTLRGSGTILRAPIPGSRYARGLRGRARLESFLSARLPDARRLDRTDLFATLCRAVTDDGHRFSPRDVVNHMIFLLMAAHDTTTAATVATAYQLARHPHWQEAARAEADEQAGSAAPVDVDRLPVLDRIVRESMRLQAPVPVLVRATTSDTELQGHTVPAGTICSVGIHVTHHLPDLWEQPERFDPDRFTRPLPHPYAWRPFGGGAHTCLGMRFAMLETKSILHAMLRSWQWRTRPGYRPRIDYTTVPTPRDGLPLEITAR
ncbi:cytochrome P450 [Pseudonocardia parietis]|uniref:Cytochrome P450 n=1 Tax=Pseudonocardia parietis TaxID=570936 RepID=A0ABS4VSY0_9PSEU|nr:cytochrome P450 [Pseudonocardia parietis]MBP2367037.1 cytochrome P450 [Pseudonocardia parietis]